MLKRLVLLAVLALSLGTAVIQASDPMPFPQCYPCEGSGSGN